MRCLILAAGYGTRMQAVIGDRPKALIDVGGRTIFICCMGCKKPLLADPVKFLADLKEPDARQEELEKDLHLHLG